MARTALGGGVVLVAAAVLLWRGNVPAPTDAGQLPTVVTVTTTVSADPPAAANTSTASTASTAHPAQTASSDHAPPAVRAPAAPAKAAAPTSGNAPTEAPSPGSEPVRLRIPTLAVTAVVQPVDSINSVLQVPQDISRVGWWRHSAPPTVHATFNPAAVHP